jgi:hypothetical protein
MHMIGGPHLENVHTSLATCETTCEYQHGHQIGIVDAPLESQRQPFWPFRRSFQVTAAAWARRVGQPRQQDDGFGGRMTNDDDVAGSPVARGS